MVSRQGGQEEEKQHKRGAVGQDQGQSHHAPVAELPPGDGVIARLRHPAQEGVEEKEKSQIQKREGIGHSITT